MNPVNCVPADAGLSDRSFIRAASVLSIVLALGSTLLPLPATAGWTSNGVAVAPSDSAQIDAAIVPDGSGGAIIAWEGQLGSSFVTPIIRLDAAGNAMPGWPMLEAQGGIRFDDVTMAPDRQGGVYVANASGGLGLTLRRVLGDGTLAAGWPTAGIGLHFAQYAPPPSRGSLSARPTATLRLQYGFFPFLAPDGLGGVIASWTAETGGANDIARVTRVTPQGTFVPGWNGSGPTIPGFYGVPGYYSDRTTVCADPTQWRVRRLCVCRERIRTRRSGSFPAGWAAAHRNPCFD